MYCIDHTESFGNYLKIVFYQFCRIQSGIPPSIQDGDRKNCNLEQQFKKLPCTDS